MARVLAYTSPARGHLYPLTPVLEELRARGHDVILRSLSSEVAVMRGRGFDASPIDPRVEEKTHDDWRGRTAQQRLARSTRTFSERARFDAADLRDAIARSAPDVVVVDINSWGALMAAEAWGGPWASFCPYPLPLSSRDVPPFGPGLAPARGPAGRIRDRLVRPLVIGTLERTMLPALNTLRTGMALRPWDSVDDLVLHLPLLLYLTAEPFEYPRTDWPPNVVMVGPCCWEPPSPPPEWLANVQRPLVLVTTSSEFQDDGRLVKAALEALAAEPVEVAVTMPSAALVERPVPRNAHVERFLPHGALLDQAVCAITHGGMGATQKALSHGVPVCAVPFGRDQLEVARRVEVAAAGTRLPARRLRPDRLRKQVLEAITCREGAARVASGFTRAGGPRAAADALERRVLEIT